VELANIEPSEGEVRISAQEDVMQASEFTARLGRMTAPEFGAVAAAIRSERDTADSELTWWRATLSVNACLRRQRRSREAGMAAHHASVRGRRGARLPLRARQPHRSLTGRDSPVTSGG
jgi:hypothetical protein